MARKRRKYKTTKTSSKVKNVIYGVLFILASVLGIGKYGIVGQILAGVAIYAVGALYLTLLVALFIIGAYLIIKREAPNFLNLKLIGFIIILIGALIILHEDFLVKANGDATMIMQNTINILNEAWKSVTTTGNVNNIMSFGGGIIGGALTSLCARAFAITGTKIVEWVLVVLGIFLFTGFSILDYIREHVNNKDNSQDDEEDNDNKKSLSNKSVIISNGEEEKETDKDTRKITSMAEVTAAPKAVEPVKSEIKADPINSNYKLPSIDLLDKVKKNSNGTDEAAIEKNIDTLEKVLRDFEIEGKVVEVHVGPTVTQYELEIKSGTKVNRILGLTKEISLALAKSDIRIEAPIPGKSTVGIEVPNDKISMVSYRETFEHIPSNKASSKLLVPLGKDIMGNVITCEIDKTPHLLVAGATGSGKSVCINGIISTILMRCRPDEVKLVMVDPKKVELSVYNGVPHLLCPVVTDPKKAAIALGKIVTEMEGRYDTFEATGTKNITTYNEYVDKKNRNANENEKLAHMPYIVVIVDELADLMLVAKKDVEAYILRITQMARAAGIHLIVATQRPSTDVVTGVVKANIPSRIAFAVSSNVDSRTILDMGGAEKLLGKGDMLFLPMGAMAPQRVQGAYISDDEIKRIIDFTVNEQKADYNSEFMNLEEHSENNDSNGEAGSIESDSDADDPLYNEIVEYVITTQKASASLLQRRFKLGYNRAARMIDTLEEKGIVGPQNGSKPRDVLVKLDNKETSNEEE
jgi:S-DNA-T family DNA segregation ATPase FtsK/SpoIIIE